MAHIEWSDSLKEQVRQMIAKGCSSAQIVEVIGKSKSAIFGAVNRYKLGGLTRAGMVPDGFEQDWPVMSIRELGRKYGVGRSTPTRWAKHLGLPLKVQNLHRSIEATPRKPKTPRKGRDAYNTVSPFDTTVYRDESEAGRAAQFLQRFGFVYRADETGKPNPRGRFWNRGGRVLTDADVIERAAFLQSRAA